MAPIASEGSVFVFAAVAAVQGGWIGQWSRAHKLYGAHHQQHQNVFTVIKFKVHHVSKMKTK